jgi:predicted transcriptional regulator
MPQTSVLVQLDPGVQARLVALAVDHRQPVSDVAAEIISLYLAPDSWEDDQIGVCLAELEAHEVVPSEHVADGLE